MLRMAGEFHFFFQLLDHCWPAEVLEGPAGRLWEAGSFFTK